MGRLSIPAVHHGGAMPGGHPRTIVVHSAECPLKAGYAESLATNWFGATAPTSAHGIVDPRDVVTMLPDNVIAWHCGNGNTRSKGWEQAGYARFERADWLTPDGLKQMRLLAAELADDCRDYGIPVRHATDAQIRIAHAGGDPAGICTHADMKRVLGGTTHTDPGDEYPFDVLLDTIRDVLNPTQPITYRWPFPPDHKVGAKRGDPRVHNGLVPGSAGRKAVKAIQRRLGLKAYGVFGARTVAAVKAFQRDNDLPQTGYVGTVTWALMRSSKRG